MEEPGPSQQTWPRTICKRRPKLIGSSAATLVGRVAQSSRAAFLRGLRQSERSNDGNGGFNGSDGSQTLPASSYALPWGARGSQADPIELASNPPKCKKCRGCRERCRARYRPRRRARFPPPRHHELEERAHMPLLVARLLLQDVRCLRIRSSSVERRYMQGCRSAGRVYELSQRRLLVASSSVQPWS